MGTRTEGDGFDWKAQQERLDAALRSWASAEKDGNQEKQALDLKRELENMSTVAQRAVKDPHSTPLESVIHSLLGLNRILIEEQVDNFEVDNRSWKLVTKLCVECHKAVPQKLPVVDMLSVALLQLEDGLATLQISMESKEKTKPKQRSIAISAKYLKNNAGRSSMLLRLAKKLEDLTEKPIPARDGLQEDGWNSIAYRLSLILSSLSDCAAAIKTHGEEAWRQDVLPKVESSMHKLVESIAVASSVGSCILAKVVEQLSEHGPSFELQTALWEKVESGLNMEESNSCALNVFERSLGMLVETPARKGSLQLAKELVVSGTCCERISHLLLRLWTVELTGQNRPESNQEGEDGRVARFMMKYLRCESDWNSRTVMMRVTCMMLRSCFDSSDSEKQISVGVKSALVSCISRAAFEDAARCFQMALADKLIRIESGNAVEEGPLGAEWFDSLLQALRSLGHSPGTIQALLTSILSLEGSSGVMSSCLQNQSSKGRAELNTSALIICLLLRCMPGHASEVVSIRVASLFDTWISSLIHATSLPDCSAQEVVVAVHSLQVLMMVSPAFVHSSTVSRFVKLSIQVLEYANRLYNERQGPFQDILLGVLLSAGECLTTGKGLLASLTVDQVSTLCVAVIGAGMKGSNQNCKLRACALLSQLRKVSVPESEESFKRLLASIHECSELVLRKSAETQDEAMLSVALSAFGELVRNFPLQDKATLTSILPQSFRSHFCKHLQATKEMGDVSLPDGAWFAANGRPSQNHWDMFAIHKKRKRSIVPPSVLQRAVEESCKRRKVMDETVPSSSMMRHVLTRMKVQWAELKENVRPSADEALLRELGALGNEISHFAAKLLSSSKCR